MKGGKKISDENRLLPSSNEHLGTKEETLQSELLEVYPAFSFKSMGLVEVSTSWS